MIGRIGSAIILGAFLLGPLNLHLAGGPLSDGPAMSLEQIIDPGTSPGSKKMLLRLAPVPLTGADSIITRNSAEEICLFWSWAKAPPPALSQQPFRSHEERGS